MEELRPLPFREAIAFFRSKGYAHPLQRFHYLDHWREEHARNFVVAKAMQDDVLSAIRAEVDRAIAEGRTVKQFQKELMPKLQKLGWWGKKAMEDPVTGETTLSQLGSLRRLETIYDTNMRTAHAAGEWAQIQRTKRSFPYLEYIQVERPTKRHSHEAYAGKVWHVDDPIWLRIFPPNGFYCSCHARQMTEGEFRRSGKTLSTSADLVERPYTNKRSGEVTTVPVGVHPGFDSNPGAAWLDLGRKVDALMPEASESARAGMRGIAENLRGRHAYDERRVLVVTDAEGVPVDTVFAPRAAPGTRPEPAAPVPEGGELVTLTALEAPASHEELVLLSRSGAAALTTVAPGGGSLSRITPLPPFAGLIDPPMPEVPMMAAFIDRMDTATPELEALPRDVAEAIISHAFLLLLERAGAITYAQAASDRLAQILEIHAGLIARLVGAAGI